MDAAATDQDQETLLAQLAQARESLDGLVRDLRAIDGELEGLATGRKQHRLLHDVCGALEELGELGGADLFWGDRTAAGTSEDHIRRVRSRVDVFQKRMDEIEERRQAVLEEIDQREVDTGWLEADLFEAQEAELRRQQEWIVEREISALPSRALTMAWARGGEEDQRFRKSLAASMLSSLLFALVVSLIDLPLRAPEETIEVPERVVRLMMEARPLPPPVRREETKPQEQLAAQKPAEEVVPQASAKAKKEGPGKGSGDGPAEGPATGPAKGLLAFREKLATATEVETVARLGSQARISGAGYAAGPSERSMVTTQAPGSSGGINLASLSRGLGGGGGSGSGGGAQIATVQIARATSTIGGGGGGGSGRSGARGGASLSRTDEEIQIVFDRHKTELYRLYNRELRRDPTLKGQIILHLRIEPDGSVSLCEVQGSDMNAPQLAAQVVDRVRTFDFGAKEGIAALTILYPIDFLPAA
jgi:hypothetical protein